MTTAKKPAKTIWVMLPAYNEEEALPRLLPKIDQAFRGLGHAYRILAVNDGSIDNTADVLEASARVYPVTIVTHRINRGLGETERDGFEYFAAHAADDDVLIRIDCDDTHEPEYFERLLMKICDGYDVVNTSRFQPGGGQLGVNAYRTLISYAANLFMRLLFDIEGVRDYSCGFRAYRASIIRHAIRVYGNGFIQLKGLGFTSTLETIVKLKLLGCRFAEVPFVLRYDKKAGPSKMVSSITTLGYFTMAFLYHWPFGGWRTTYAGLSDAYRASAYTAVELYARENIKRSMLCRFGGG